MSVQLQRRLFSVREYHQMIEIGMFPESDRLELITGELIQMSPIGSRHAACVARLNAVFSQRLAEKAIVWPQNPVILDDHSEPQPDIALLRRRPDFYQSGNPQKSDIFLLGEVADTSIGYDRDVKIPLYAKNRIPEVWLIDLNQSSLEIYRDSDGNSYQTIQPISPGATLNILAFPAITFNYSDILG
nr:Uma2 family endonuclease [[Phormidium] sp. ETS-05]